MSSFKVPKGWQAPYIGIPWKLDGYSLEALSCWGLGCQAWSDVAGVALPSFADKLPQDHNFSTERVRAVNQLILDEIDIMRLLDKPQPLALVHMRKGQNLTHIGLYAFGGWIVHADEDVGCVVQERVDNLNHAITGYYWPSDDILKAD